MCSSWNGILPCWACGCYCRDKQHAGDTAIITGANQGIGVETAKALAKKGMNVIVTCRSVEKGERAVRQIQRACCVCVKSKVEYRVCDLSSLRQVREFAAEINKRVDDGELRLTTLVNNAGIMACPYGVSEDGYEMQFAVNHLGHFVLTLLLLRALRAAAPARIVNVSSIAHYGGNANMEFLKNSYESGARYNDWGAYGASKFCNVLFTHELGRRMAGTGVSVIAVHPGVIRSNLWQHMSCASCFLCKCASDGAKPSIYAASGGNGDSLNMEFLVPKCCCTCKLDADPASYSYGSEAKLWEISMEMGKLKDMSPAELGLEEGAVAAGKAESSSASSESSLKEKEPATGNPYADRAQQPDRYHTVGMYQQACSGPHFCCCCWMCC